MSFNLVFQTLALGAYAAMALGCGGAVVSSRGDNPCEGSGSASTAGYPLAQCASTSEPRSSGGASSATTTTVAATTGFTSGGITTVVTTSTFVTTVTTTGVTTVATTGSTALQYSQNASVTSGDGASEGVTCYGVTDGSACTVSDINFAAGPIHTVTCSTDGTCTCVVQSHSGPAGVIVATFPFSAGMCPSGSFGTVAWTNTLANVPAEICTDYGMKLFARCGW